VTQLDALRDVVGSFDAAGIDYWLFGGWAVDFYASAVTRDHDDVDVAIWLNDMPRIESVLSAAGWIDLQDPDVDGGKAFGREGVRLELTYLYLDDDGEIYTPLLDGTRGRWTREALGEDVATLDGVRARIVALAPLMRMKARGRGDDPLDAAKDKADHDALRNLVEKRTFS
jgi:hypothetical protein